MTDIQLAEIAPGHDEWFYDVSIDPQTFGKSNAYVSDGQRTIQRMRAGSHDIYRKWDIEDRGKNHLDGAREKIAADLAQLCAAAVPAVLLWRDGDQTGCAQKEPLYFVQNLKMLSEAIEVDPDNASEVLSALVAGYDPMNAFLDVWTGNRDRYYNYQNTLIAENSSTLIVWIIDFNNSLGHVLRPWSEHHEQNHGLDATSLPAPKLIVEMPEWINKLRVHADDLQSRLAAIDVGIIDLICERALAFYASKIECDELKVTLRRCLGARRNRVKEWIWELL